MKFDINTGAGEWFPFFRSEVDQNGDIKYFDPEEGGGRVKLRITDPDVMEEIQNKTRKKVTEWLWHPKTHQPYSGTRFEQTPAQEKKERELVWDYAIIAWEGILDAEGAEIPCTLENKMKLMGIPVFARFVGRCLQLVSSASIDREKELEKN